MKNPDSPICQSCGMPVDKPFDFGTDKDNYHVTEYCRRCYKKGRFTERAITMEQMIEKAAATMVKTGGISPAEAKKTANEVIPTLKRWQKK